MTMFAGFCVIWNRQSRTCSSYSWLLMAASHADPASALPLAPSWPINGANGISALTFLSWACSNLRPRPGAIHRGCPGPEMARPSSGVAPGANPHRRHSVAAIASDLGLVSHRLMAYPSPGSTACLQQPRKPESGSCGITGATPQTRFHRRPMVWTMPA